MANLRGVGREPQMSGYEQNNGASVFESAVSASPAGTTGRSEESEQLIMRIGIYVYAIASAAVGILDLLWGELEPAQQPLQAWGDHIPGTTTFAYIATVWLIAGGAAMLWQRSRRFGAAALTILYGIFVLFPLPRLYTAPHFLGYRAAVYLSVMVTVCQQIILVVAAAIVWKSLDTRSSLSQRAGVIARWGLRSLLG